MSRRRSRASDRQRAERERQRAEGERSEQDAVEPAERGRREGERRTGGGRPWAPLLLAQAGVLVAVFAVAVLVAELAGAANLGVAFGIGQIAFAIALVYLLVRG